MDQENIAEAVPPTAEQAASVETTPKRGPILATLQIRVTIRGEEPGSYVPTNDEIAEWTEEAFRARGYAQVNATAEKV
jgi:hypothetical protein